MPLTPGTRLGPYEISEPIGKGGMGEVYRARDTKLDRDVAIKVLPDELAADEERVARFEREAKLLASLNHPNIASIYGFESNALVLELVEGPTLAERIERGPIPADEAIAIAKQIAEALEAGHEAGVIHRDLKPANIKLKEDGTVKVLDYGLAKALEGEAAQTTDSELSQSPTLTRQGTQVGVILGTAAYMSPEQAKGKRVDKRTDIWAFGSVLYEMLTGEKAFKGEDVPEILASAINKEPEWESLPRDLDTRLRHLLSRCLRKDRKKRLQSAGDARIELEDIATEPAQAAPSKPDGPRRSRASFGWGASILAAAIAGGLIASRFRSEPENPVGRFAVGTMPRAAVAGIEPVNVAISPDGNAVAFISIEDGEHKLFLRHFDRLDAVLLFSSPTWLGNPFFSPDGRWVGFTTFSDQLWNKISVLGGPPVKLFPSPRSPHGASWGPDDSIIYSLRAPNEGLLRGSAESGAFERLTTLDVEDGEIAHQSPHILPDGQHVLFTVVKESPQIAVLDSSTGKYETLIPAGRNARYARSGHIVFGMDGTLFAVPFDSERLEVTGDPVPVLPGVIPNATGDASFDLATNGSLIYVAGNAGSNPRRSLVWVDRQGREEPLGVDPSGYRHPRVSPDGSRLAVDTDDEGQDIWIWDFSRETMSRLTSHPDFDGVPIWTPDGDSVVFSSSRDEEDTLYRKAAHGMGAAERLGGGSSQQPMFFGPGGDRLVFQQQVPGDVRRFADLRVLSLEGDRTVEPLLVTDFIDANPAMSPGGRFFAYQSNRTGQFEIYVRPFSAGDEASHQLSKNGGTQPLWAPDGSELFYLDSGGRLVSVPVRLEPSIEFGSPEIVLAKRYYTPSGTDVRNYDVSPDGERFLRVKEAGGEDSSRLEIILVQNWLDELERLVPTN